MLLTRKNNAWTWNEIFPRWRPEKFYVEVWEILVCTYDNALDFLWRWKTGVYKNIHHSHDISQRSLFILIKQAGILWKSWVPYQKMKKTKQNETFLGFYGKCNFWHFQATFWWQNNFVSSLCFCTEYYDGNTSLTGCTYAETSFVVIFFSNTIK